ncbi:MAG TPA: zinc ribbon domain-containing protein [Ktedonobacteraceae bacterium]|nr:zinc ribbon domain-containing protein [Ktedonobacteraceae bacterium]
MTDCPQCGTPNGDDAKNCQMCRVNLYWAFQHYEELASLREANRLNARPKTATFLVETSKKIDDGPTAGWLQSTIRKFGFKGAGKKVSTMAD